VPVAWFIAQRYFRSQRRTRFLSFITTIAVIGVAMGTAALILTVSILDGFEREIKGKVIDFSAHIQIQGYQNGLLPHPNESRERVRTQVPGVRVMVPFVSREGMVQSRDGVDGVFLKGVSAGADALTPARYVVRGGFLSAARDGASQVVIGEKLAVRLNVGVGDRLVIYGLPGSSRSLQPRAKQFAVCGVYESGMSEYDDVYAYTDLASAQALFQTGDAVTGYDVLVDDLAKVELTAHEIEELLGYPHYARSVFQLYRNLFSWVDLQKQLSPLLLSLIIIVATVNIIGTLLMFVLEKMRAIGILKSLGAGPTLIRRIFILQGLSIAVIGIVLGNLIALALLLVQREFRVFSLPADIYYMNTVPVVLSPANFVLVSAVAFVLCLVTTLLPSRAAAKMDPVNALRFG
jgi:lipoprotein-releasing system permease protein